MHRELPGCGFEAAVHGPEGDFTFMFDGVAHELATGQARFVGRGPGPQFDIMGTTDGVFLSVATPGNFGARNVQEIAAVLETSPDPMPWDALFGVTTRQTAGRRFHVYRTPPDR